MELLSLNRSFDAGSPRGSFAVPGKVLMPAVPGEVLMPAVTGEVLMSAVPGKVLMPAVPREVLMSAMPGKVLMSLCQGKFCLHLFIGYDRGSSDTDCAWGTAKMKQETESEGK